MEKYLFLVPQFPNIFVFIIIVLVLLQMPGDYRLHLPSFLKKIQKFSILD